MTGLVVVRSRCGGTFQHDGPVLPGPFRLDHSHSRKGDVMFDPQKLLDQFLGGQAGDGKKGGVSPDLIKGLAGGAVAGGLASILMGSKGGKKLAKGALEIGGAAVLGGLAYKAYQTWQANKGVQTTVPAGDMK